MKAVEETDDLPSQDFKHKEMCRHFYCKHKKYWDLEVIFKHVERTVRIRSGLFIY